MAITCGARGRTRIARRTFPGPPNPARENGFGRVHCARLRAHNRGGFGFNADRLRFGGRIALAELRRRTGTKTKRRCRTERNPSGI